MPDVNRADILYPRLWLKLKPELEELFYILRTRGMRPSEIARARMAVRVYVREVLTVEAGEKLASSL